MKGLDINSGVGDDTGSFGSPTQGGSCVMIGVSKRNHSEARGTSEGLAI